MAGDARDLCNHVVSAGTDVLTDVVNSSLVQNVLQSQVMRTKIAHSVVDPDPVGSGTFWLGRVERIVLEEARSFFCRLFWVQSPLPTSADTVAIPLFPLY